MKTTQGIFLLAISGYAISWILGSSFHEYHIESNAYLETVVAASAGAAAPLFIDNVFAASRTPKRLLEYVSHTLLVIALAVPVLIVKSFSNYWLIAACVSQNIWLSYVLLHELRLMLPKIFGYSECVILLASVCLCRYACGYGQQWNSAVAITFLIIGIGGFIYYLTLVGKAVYLRYFKKKRLSSSKYDEWATITMLIVYSVLNLFILITRIVAGFLAHWCSYYLGTILLVQSVLSAIVLITPNILAKWKAGESDSELLDMKRSLVRHMSHEIRTPLSVATVGLELLATMSPQASTSPLRSDPLPELEPSHESLTRTSTGHASYTRSESQYQSIIAELQECITSAEGILSNMLDYSKVESGLMTLHRTYENPVRLFDGALRMYRLHALTKNIAITCNFEKPVLKPMENTAGKFVLVDAPKIQQVIRNLLSNAVKFTPNDGSINIDITVVSTGHHAEQCHTHSWPSIPLVNWLGASYQRMRAASIGVTPSAPDRTANARGRVVSDKDSSSSQSVGSDNANMVPMHDYALSISIKDTGVGIPQEHLQSIFKEMLHVKSSGKEAHVTYSDSDYSSVVGSGVGLCIAKGILSLHGGDIRVFSEGVGKGAQFTIQLPLYEPMHLAKLRKKNSESLSLASLVTVGDIELGDMNEGVTVGSNARVLVKPKSVEVVKNGSPSSNVPTVDIPPRVTPSPGVLLALKNLDDSTDDAGMTKIVDTMVGGTTFAAPLPDDDEADTIQKNVTTTVKPLGRKLNVLIVDDSKLNRKMIGRALEQDGHRYDMLENGLELVERMRVLLGMQPPSPSKSKEESNGTTSVGACGSMIGYDVILLDNCMPVMDGPKAIKKLREWGYDKPVIGVTGHALPEDLQQFTDAGVNEIIIKPVKINDVRRVLHKYAGDAV